MVEHFHFALLSPGDELVRRHPAFAEKEWIVVVRTLEEIRALIIDEEKVRHLDVVGAAGGAALNIEIKRHCDVAAVRCLERDVVHRQTGNAGRGDQHRLFERRQWLRSFV